MPVSPPVTLSILDLEPSANLESPMTAILAIVVFIVVIGALNIAEFGRLD